VPVIRPSAQVRATIQRTTPPLLILLAAAIILVGKADQTMFDSLRINLTDDAAPALDALSRPLAAAGGVVDRVRGVVTMYQDNLRLEAENERLLQWQQVAMKLSGDNRELRRLLKVVPDNAVSYVTTRVIANSGGGYVRSVMVNAGSEQGLARGQATVTGAGLVGRLTEVGSRAARVLLLTDLNSRIPVVVEGSRVNAMLAGDNSEQPRLVYVTEAETLKIGDRIVTSGEGGVFPPGLPVGVVARIDHGTARVEPFVELSQLGHVLIVDYGLSGGLPQPVPMAANSGRRGKQARTDDSGAR
jgi:rod shape-determining protein MreC